MATEAQLLSPSQSVETGEVEPSHCNELEPSVQKQLGGHFLPYFELGFCLPKYLEEALESHHHLPFSNQVETDPHPLVHSNLRHLVNLGVGVDV